MEDLQSALQAVLSDPEQMARVAALAESLGLKPPDDADAGAATPSPASRGGGPASRPVEGCRPSEAETSRSRHSERSEESVPPSSFAESDGINIGQVMNLLSASSGGETKVLSALRTTLDPEGQNRVDRALRAARLSRLAGTLLAQRRGEHV